MNDWQKGMEEGRQQLLKHEREKQALLRDLINQGYEMQAIMQANLDELRRFKAWLGGKSDFYPDEKEGEVNADQ
jgi:hypothetical protein